MRLKSDTIREEILNLAKEEFLKKGFREASLRNIAKKANRTTGVIYTYFKNKDELFEQLVQPVIQKIDDKLSSKKVSFDEARETGLNLKNWFTTYIRFLIELAEHHPDEMNLLFLKSEGSSFANYKNELIETGIRRAKKDFSKLQRTKEFEGQEISEFFFRNLVNYVLNVAIEMIRQKCNKAEIERYEAEITAFLYNGWKSLLKV